MSAEDEANRIERERVEKEWRATTRACILFSAVVVAGLLLNWWFQSW